MDQSYIPPQMIETPQQFNAADGNLNNQNLNNAVPRQESREAQGAWVKSVARSAHIKKAASTIIRTRGDFKQYLQQNGMDLFTSAIDFQQTGDFITSSYVIYRNHNDYREPLINFLNRYPQLQQPVIQIREQLRSQQSNMQVITPKLSNPHPFDQFSQM